MIKYIKSLFMYQVEVFWGHKRVTHWAWDSATAYDWLLCYSKQDDAVVIIYKDRKMYRANRTYRNLYTA